MIGEVRFDLFPKAFFQSQYWKHCRQMEVWDMRKQDLDLVNWSVIMTVLK